MNWTTSANNRANPGFLDYDAGPPLPPRNQLATSRAIRLSDSADLLYEVPHEFSNQSAPAYDGHPIYATVQRKSYRYPQEDPLSRPSSQSSTGTWSSYSQPYATMTWKRTPPPKPPRKSVARSLSQQQYHSKSQHQLHLQSNRAFGYEFVPIGSAGESLSSGGSDSMKRSASNDGDAAYAELKLASSSGNSSGSRFSTFLGSNNAQHERDSYDSQRLMSDSAFSLLYDEIASSNSSTLPNPHHLHKLAQARGHGHHGGHPLCPVEALMTQSQTSTSSSTASAPPATGGNSKVSSLSRKGGRAPSLSQHTRSKSEHHPGHHPLCPNNHFHDHPHLPPRPPLPPKPQSAQGPRKRDSGEGQLGQPAPHPHAPSLRKTHSTNGRGSPPMVTDNADYAPDLHFPERPPSPESAVDGIRSVIKPLSKRKKDNEPSILTACHRDSESYHLLEPASRVRDQDRRPFNSLSLDRNEWRSACSSRDCCLELDQELEYKSLSRTRRKDMETSVEENLFSSFDSTGKMVQVRLRRPANWSKLDNKQIATEGTFEDLIEVRLRDNAATASTLPRSSATNRLSKASIEDGKKSLRRTKHHASDHTGTAERRKKKGLFKSSKDASNSSDSVPKDGHEKQPLSTTLVITAIDIDSEPTPAPTSPPEASPVASTSPSASLNGSVTEPSQPAMKPEAPAETPSAASSASAAPVASECQAKADKPPASSPLPPKRGGTPLIPFDANKEWAEIEKILESFGSDLCSETIFLDELEKQFTAELNKDRRGSSPAALALTTSVTSLETHQKPALSPKPLISEKPSRAVLERASSAQSQSRSTSRSSSRQESAANHKSVSAWIAELGISAQHAELLIENGFDDLQFMGPNGLDAGELEELGMNGETIATMLEAAKVLPALKQFDKEACNSVSVDEWLTSLGLREYVDVFLDTGFTDMRCVRKIWEVELNALLGIKKLGHRKRILASLGKRLSVVQI